MANWSITVHKADGDIERSIVTADTEAEARRKFEAQSTEFIVSIHEIKHGLPPGFRVDPFADARLGRSLFEMRPEDWIVRR